MLYNVSLNHSFENHTIMNNQNLEINYFSSSNTTSFEAAVLDIIHQLDFEDRVAIRFVFFGSSNNNRQYNKELSAIQQHVYEKFGDEAPVISYVAQKPLSNVTLVLEVHSILLSADRQIRFAQCNNIRYITIEDEKSKNLSIGGVVADDFNKTVFNQSSEIFDTIKKILLQEEMPVQSIVRQWNYIAQITCVMHERQYYQEFNDARSYFYNQTNWASGYPAATGIGTESGGVVVDLFAVKSKTDDVQIFALDNKLQIAAHAYSQNVLVGQDDKELKTKTTPKFERGKVVNTQNSALIYISGTAAIRGEGSLAETDIEQQTIITLENIEELISTSNLTSAGVKIKDVAKVKCLRIYLKQADFYQVAKMVVDKMLPNVPAVYLLGDICRDNLLIEIEGIAVS